MAYSWQVRLDKFMNCHWLTFGTKSSYSSLVGMPFLDIQTDTNRSQASRLKVSM